MNNLITWSFQFIRPTTKHLRIRFTTFFCIILFFFSFKMFFFVFHLVHPMVQKTLKSMKKWASYVLWKWRSWFAKTEHNSSVCVFEFKLFACYSAFNIPTNFVILFLAHPMVQKLLKSMKKWTSYAIWKWRGWYGKTNITIQFVFSSLNYLYIASLPLTFKNNL